MSGISWWRSWHGAPMDHKWAVIAVRSGGVKPGIVSAIAWALFDYASQQADRGSVIGFDIEEYAVFSGFPGEEISDVIGAMEAKGIIINGRLANWEKRQPKREDDSNARVREWREKKRNVTHGNAPETEKDTESDTESDKETDKDKETETEARPLLFAMYEREIGIISPRIRDELLLAEKEYPLEWFIDGFKEAADHNARSWKYVLAILRRWKTDGRSNTNGHEPKTEKQPAGHWAVINGQQMFIPEGVDEPRTD